jgi:hypothetical protein
VRPWVRALGAGSEMEQRLTSQLDSALTVATQLCRCAT